MSEKFSSPYGAISSHDGPDTQSTSVSLGARRRRSLTTVIFVASLVFVWLLVVSFPFKIPVFLSKGHRHSAFSNMCFQADPLLPSIKSDKLDDMDAFLASEAFEKASILRLSGAVQVPTQSFDDLGPIGEDKRWDVMYDFEAYLRKTFPLVFTKLSVELVNTHGLLVTWNGTDDELKPTLLMAHQDVVPVPDSTVPAWTHPPFSGFYDGKSIWGRGSSDCKNQLIAILEAVELLLTADFVPKRTLLLSFGFDEEISGKQGAGTLAPFLLDRYGENSMATLVDEGAGFAFNWGQATAMPGVGEKGAIDVEVTVRMPGGHSSIPSPHTSIGVMSQLIELIESNPYEPWLADYNPYLSTLYCGAEHSPDFPSSLSKALRERANGHQRCKKKKDGLAHEAAKAGLGTRYLFQTSVAADIINGGVKANALPERTTLVVDHRVNIGETTQDVERKFTRLAKAIARRNNLTLHAFDGVEEPSSISLKAWGSALQPAPVSPIDPTTNTPYSVLSGTVRGLYGEDVIVAPGLMTGNTDTRFYWNLTRHIFRFGPGWDGESAGLGNIHTVDEHISVKNHINAAKWFSLFIRNMDEADLRS